MPETIKYSHETGKLAHLEYVILLTESLEELGITSFNTLSGDVGQVVRLMCQKAFDHGKNSRSKP